MRKLLLILLFLGGWATASVAQDRTVSGKVTSADDGSTLPGVTVVLKGTTNGTTTDLDGNYKLSVPTDGGILVFSFVGMTPQETEIGSRSVIDVSLQSDAQQLTEVVVTGSAVGKSKKTLSFAVGSVDEKMMTEVPTTNLGAGLQGKVAGLRVASTGGQPGQGVSFQARGANSLSTGQNPLIIVDGAFLNGSTLADINPEDIEKIEVLKGSAGASLYGSQAANGVIQIFTKRGTGIDEGRTKVVYRGEYGQSSPVNRFPTAKTHYYQLDGSGNFAFDGSGNRIIEADQIADNPWPNYHDNQDILFRNGQFSSNFVSVSGRNAGTNFFLSAQNTNDQGVIDGVDGFKRTSMKLNVDHRFNNKVDISTSTMYSSSTQDRLPNNGTTALINNLLFYPPFYDIVNSTNSEDGSQYDWDLDSLGSTIRNPLYTLHNRQTTVDRSRLIGSARLNYDATDWLSFNGVVSLDRSTNNFEEHIEKGFLSDDLRAGVQYDPSTPSNGPGGGLERSSMIRESLISRVNAIVQKKFGDFNTAFRLSYLYEELTSDFNSARGDDYSAAGIRSLDNVQQNYRMQSNSEIIVANSFFAIADIDYQEKFIFSGLVRREGSSLFGPEERWANYFRTSFAYRLTEDFTINNVDELKFRASYGTAGIRPTYEMRFETYTLQNGSSSPGTASNELLKPARSGELELGLNARLFNRFDFEFNYSKTTTKDQILRVPLPAPAGFSAVWRNAGTVESETFEFTLGADIIRAGDFTWNLGINFDKTKQEITQLDVPAYNTGPGNQQSTIFRVEEGRPFGTMYGQKFATSLSEIDAMGAQGLTDGNGDVFNSANYVVNAAGYVVLASAAGTTTEAPVKLQDAAGNDLVTSIGNITPDFRMGFANNLSYKNLSVYALFDWKKGGDIYNQSRQWLFRDLMHEDVGKYPIATSFWSGLYNVNVPNSAFVEDGSFFMLRELSIAYTLDKSQLSGLFGDAVQSIKFGVVGRNLFTITDYSGFHPDISSTPVDENQLTSRQQDGIGSNANNPTGDPNVFYFDSFVYPLSRTFSGSIQITF